MKLFTIGDSISQGFMSGAAARTDLCYSTLIAQAMEIDDYRVPEWPLGGHPINLERLLRRLQRRFGNDIFGPFEWVAAADKIIGLLDEVEDHYERGSGSETKPYPGGVEWFHNVAVRGFDVGDAWMVTPSLCREQISASDRGRSGRDNTFGTPNESVYRTALTVLNPSRSPDYDDYCALRWLEAHANDESGQGGVENLIIWLGPNNALGTVLELDIKPTPNDPSRRPTRMSRSERQDYNLWTPDDFEDEYQELMGRVDAIMEQNVAQDWRVFVGTAPAVTIAPLAKGVGPHETREDPFGVLSDGARYYKYYTYFPFEASFARGSSVALSMDQAYRIDQTIAHHNKTIRAVVAEYNKKARDRSGQQFDRYVLVDTAEALLRAAFKRNNGNPTYAFPPYFDDLPLKPNTKYYHATRGGRIVQGGLFSIDGVHPSAIGQGLVAHEFLKVMRQSGVALADETKLNWPDIFASDSLWRSPLSIMQELYEHETLAEWLIRWLR